MPCSIIDIMRNASTMQHDTQHDTQHDNADLGGLLVEAKAISCIMKLADATRLEACRFTTLKAQAGWRKDIPGRVLLRGGQTCTRLSPAGDATALSSRALGRILGCHR